MPAPSKLFESAFRELIDTLESQPFPYCLLGGLALGLWAAPRATQDLDILAAVREQQRSQLIGALEGKGFEFDRQWAEDNPMIRTWHLRFRRGMIPVDLLLPRDVHDREVLERRRRLKLHELSLWVITPEDLVLHKLKAGRPRDFEDAVSVLVRQKTSLDLAYLNNWAQRLGITEELGYCLDQSTEP